MSHRPLVAVPADNILYQHCEKYAISKQYLNSLFELANVSPIIIPPLLHKNVADILKYVNGILLTGAVSNVHPSRYNSPVTEQHQPFDEERDAISFSMIDYALKYNLPILGVCRGLQELNTYLGGTLSNDIQELDGKIDHRSCDSTNISERFKIKHTVNIVPNRLLDNIINQKSISVNSLHRQAIDVLADKLQIEAIATDNTIEAVSMKDTEQFILAFQWHPEYWYNNEAISKKIFAAFSKAIYEDYTRKN
ncbi:gamma-glutamyl-gamma-aminobutyrate hydrolase family protein [Bartonella sp. DGB1]|uniref:gamma-glutamyl-gamma-aminobutyrate hydrolase family protein n=1 Tax=Bartonella sp. DGB1 TaxID=3239807 RepID=UPI0035253EEE